jgi:hypothetical protein
LGKQKRQLAVHDIFATACIAKKRKKKNQRMNTTEEDQVNSKMHNGDLPKRTRNKTREKQRHEHCTYHSYIKSSPKICQKPMHSHCIPAEDMLDMDKTRLLYNEMYDDCLLETLPLTKITDLVTTGSCIPSIHNATDAIIKTISHAIMRRLMCVIPVTNIGMLDILGPFNKDRDGYGDGYNQSSAGGSEYQPEAEFHGELATRTVVVQTSTRARARPLNTPCFQNG